MKKQILFFVIILLSANCFAQITFEQGYFINISDEKVDCLIKNVDWKSSPTDFKYKLQESDEPIMVTIESVKEFGIDNVSKYIRATVKIDKSSESINNLSTERNPIFEEEQVFLKVLVEGKANLYLYENGKENLRRFFYKVDKSTIEQLVYKQYKVYEYGYEKVGSNNQFRQQLLNSMSCAAIKLTRITSLDYRKSSLTKFFVAYNACHNSTSINYEKKQKRDFFNLTFRPRFSTSSLSIENVNASNKNTNFDTNRSVGFGVDFELIFPFNKNKWSISFEPTYQAYKTEKVTEVDFIAGDQLVVQVDYTSVEVPVCLKHYFFLNENAKIYLGAAYVFDFSSEDSFIDFRRANNTNLSTLDVRTHSNLAFGLGVKLRDRYSLEMRYFTPREILGDYSFWYSDYKSASIIFGYSIL